RSWRWMGRRGTVALLGGAETMSLRLRAITASVPGVQTPPTIVLRVDGTEVDRFTPKALEFDRTIVIKTDPTRIWSTLTIENDQAVIPSRIGSIADDRELGLQLFTLHWSPAPGAAGGNPFPDQFLGSGWYPLE